MTHPPTLTAEKIQEIESDGLLFLPGLPADTKFLAALCHMAKAAGEYRAALREIALDGNCLNTVNAPRCGDCDVCELSMIARKALEARP